MPEVLAGCAAEVGATRNKYGPYSELQDDVESFLADFG